MADPIEIKMEEEGQRIKPKKASKNRGIDTVFRVSLANQLELISIADQKANIIIGINTFIISIVLVLGSGYHKISISDKEQWILYLPVLGLLLFCLVSGIFSILAARPIKPLAKGKRTGFLYADRKETADVENYLQNLKNMLQSNEQIIEGLGTDMFFQEQAINRKYKMLRVSYNVFLAGIILAVALFLIFLCF